jgi:Ni,Fe-hydrogenase III small subunit
MANWVLRGLLTGVKTTPYPAGGDRTAGLSPGRPMATRCDTAAQITQLTARCPSGAILPRDGSVAIEHGRCVHCLRCKSSGPASADWTPGYEWAAVRETENARQELDKAFGGSLHIRFVDAGACGGCVSEARQLNNPYYNMHRLGFFTTPTPRNADVLMVAGPVSDAMRLPLVKTYEAIPEPKRVMAIGACAISGGVFGPSFAASGGVETLIPVDIVVPGCPPPPLAILHGLLVLVRHKPPAARISQFGAPGKERRA